MKEVLEDNGNIIINLPVDFNIKANLGYLERNKNECMFEVENEMITRVIVIGETQTLVKIYVNEQNQMIVTFLKNSRPQKRLELEEVVKYIREWFDLDRDLTPFYTMAKADPLLLRPVNEFFGLRLIGVPDLFEALCWGVLGQQINLAFAYTLKSQFVEKFGDSIEWNGKNYWIFPTYEKIAKLTPVDLADIKMTLKKSEYIIGIAQLMARGELSKDKLMKMENLKETEKSLIKIRGIGPWTANYVLMRCLRYPSAYPIDDVGLHNAIKHLTKSEQKPSKEVLLKLALRWEGWQAYATFYLWRVLY
ncbi:DNA-3-methyladenine glycosidase [Neobacillus bataviensis LMG 21833]|uniref:DNA-3-methyladenine glycosylase II n=1 Tax=Neobacillus bataviensis LMG 21833 TaxID=1117379 RepID=K6E699_9BACI|nr:DNA-3-methyladenine glycosylase [Neobacillus bataviensis]EKN68806.1 DNA-3-methyladenine glycosidase [Neobacillus bataviensis LMG 21833]